MPPSPLRAASHGLALLALCGCPQLLDDDFELRRPRLTDSLPDETGGAAGAPPFGTAGAGGTGSQPGTAGTGALADAGQPAADAAAPDAATGGEPDATPVPGPLRDALREALVHRYSFNAGATLLDSVGTAHASSLGVSFSEGAAVFAGGGEYLDLPNELMTGLENCTIETWLVWSPGDVSASTASWQRIFDFGRNSALAEGAQGSDANAIYLTPKSGGVNGKLHVEYESNGNISLNGPAPLPTELLVHVVAVVDDTNDSLSMYLDGVSQGELPFTGSLGSISYRNNWLGRSQYEGDPSFAGRMLDFRIYSAALSPALIAASLALGPDAEL